MNSEDVEREFGILRDLTKRTGMLAEPQLEQLKKWPTSILQRRAEIVFSPEDRAVLYDIEGEGLPSETELNYLSICTKWLLGNDVKVGIRSSTDSWVDAYDGPNSVSVSDV